MKPRYDKFVMTPLIMDYGYKWQDKLEGDEIYYDEIAAKPVVNQTLDLLNGIADFYRSSPSYRDWIEIYPFLGINPINYSFGDETTERIYEWVSKTNIPSNLQSVADFLPLAGKPGLIFKGRMSEEQKQSLMTLLTDKRSRQAVERIYRRSQHIGDKTAKPRNTLPRMLDKYFKDYGKKTGASRYEALKSHLGKFDGDIHVSELAYYFAGIKLYPPLGFHPWPSDNPYELAKVKYLYQFCIDNRIPITVHCGSDGFAVVDNPDSLTDPANWQKALSYTDEKGVQPYRELTINLAHWGGDALTNHKWLDIIGDLIVEYPNVYTDLSCQLFEPDAYRRVPECITTTGKDDKARIAKIRSRILFGSDFSINLAIQARSYQEYLKAYSETSELTKEEKQSYAQSNAERFLWGIEG